MRFRDVFGLIVRIVALFLAVWGLFYTVGGVVGAAAGASDLNAIYGVVFLVIGLAMLRGASVIVSFTYGREPVPGRCAKCGYDLRGSPGDCPECGTPRVPVTVLPGYP